MKRGSIITDDSHDRSWFAQRRLSDRGSGAPAQPFAGPMLEYLGPILLSFLGSSPEGADDLCFHT